MMPNDSYFRAGAGTIIFNDSGEVVVFKRVRKGAGWQFSQGGLDVGEDPLEGAVRELQEETGITADQITLIGEYPGWVSYEIPEKNKFNQEYRGQSQRWFFAKLLPGVEIDLERAVEPEFNDYKWVTYESAVADIVEFKRDMNELVYRYYKEQVEK